MLVEVLSTLEGGETGDWRVLEMKNNIYALGRILNQLNYVLDSRQKKACVSVFLCMVAASGLELLGVSVIYPFLQIMISPIEMKEKWYVKWIYYFIPDISEKAILLALGVVIIVIKK